MWRIHTYPRAGHTITQSHTTCRGRGCNHTVCTLCAQHSTDQTSPATGSGGGWVHYATCTCTTSTLCCVTWRYLAVVYRAGVWLHVVAVRAMVATVHEAHSCVCIVPPPPYAHLFAQPTRQSGSAVQGRAGPNHPCTGGEGRAAHTRRSLAHL
jgi:hypothetical protein